MGCFWGFLRGGGGVRWERIGENGEEGGFVGVCMDGEEVVEGLQRGF